MTYKDYIEEPEIPILSRNDPIPLGFVWHVRKRVNPDGTETEVKRTKLYNDIL